MSKHRKDEEAHGVMVCPLYFGKRNEAVGTIVITEDREAVLVFDDSMIGKTLKEFLEGKLRTAIDEAHMPEDHIHEVHQHRDGKPPWCHVCGLTEDYQKPEAIFKKLKGEK